MTQIELINNELNRRGISQREFCNSIQIYPSTFSTWKTRNTRIPSKYINPICNFFEWPAHLLLNCESENDAPEIVINEGINNNLNNSNITKSNVNINAKNGIESEFLNSFNKLSFADKAKVIALVAELSEGEKNEKQQQQTEQ